MLEYSARAAIGPNEKPALLRGREVLQRRVHGHVRLVRHGDVYDRGER